MKVTILGSGTAVPVADRFPSGVLVEAGDQVLVVDLGPGVLRRLAQAGRGPEHITTILLTHYHTDHCADLAALLFALRNPMYAGRPPLTILGKYRSMSSCPCRNNLCTADVGDVYHPMSYLILT